MKWISKIMLPKDVQDFLRSYVFSEETLSIVSVNSSYVLVTILGKPSEQNF